MRFWPLFAYIQSIWSVEAKDRSPVIVNASDIRQGKLPAISIQLDR